MSISQKVFFENSIDAVHAESPVLILEEQLAETLQLQWHIHQVQLRASGGLATKTRCLLDGMASEFGTFADLIRRHLEYRQIHNRRVPGLATVSYGRLFEAESTEVGEQLRSILSACVHYERKTKQAIDGLHRSGDLESARLLNVMAKVVERCLWILEVYLESLVLNTETCRLPNWSEMS